MNRKTMIIFSFLIIISLTAIISLSVRVENKTNIDKSETVPSIEGVMFQGESIIKHNDNIYMIEPNAQKIIKYNVASDISSLVANFSGQQVGNQLYLINNHLIFTLDGNTYHMDLEGKNKEKLVNGEVVYINDEVYVYIHTNNNSQSLYIMSYDNSTFRTTKHVSFNLANGKKIKFLKEEDKSLYFTSRNTDGSSTLFEVNLNESKTNIISRQELGEYVAADAIDFSDVSKTDNYYYIVNNLIETNDGELIVGNELWKRTVGGGTEFIDSYEPETRLAINPDSNNILYENFNYDIGKYEWREESDILNKYTWRDLLYGDVTKYFELKISEIYVDGRKLVNLDENYIDSKISKVFRHEDGFFILIENNSTHTWYYCKEDESNLKKVYEFTRR